MMNFPVSLSVYFIEMLIAYIVFSSISEKKQSAITVFLLGSMIFGSGAVVNYCFSNTVWINVLYSAIINLVFALLCFHIHLQMAVIFAVLMDLFAIAFEFTTIFSFSAIASTELTTYNNDLTVLAVETAISKTLYFLSCILLMRVPKRTSTANGKIPVSFYFHPVCTLFALVAFWYISAHENLNSTDQILLSYTSIALMSATVILFITYQHNLEKDNELIRIKSENRRLQTDKSYYDILEHQNQQLMIYAHDTKNHLAAIQNLSDDPQINDYIQKLSVQLKAYTNNFHCGNKILDVIISKYVTECELRGVSFTYDVKPCNLSDMEDIDVVSILGNLLDNALTAAEKSRKKYMSLATTWRNSYSVIIITNSSDDTPVSFNNILKTTKTDSDLHGFGLRSVKKTLKKYQGDFDWEYDIANKRFIVTVMVGTATEQVLGEPIHRPIHIPGRSYRKKQHPQTG